MDLVVQRQASTAAMLWESARGMLEDRMWCGGAGITALGDSLLLGLCSRGWLRRSGRRRGVRCLGGGLGGLRRRGLEG